MEGACSLMLKKNKFLGYFGQNFLLYFTLKDRWTNKFMKRNSEKGFRLYISLFLIK